MKKFARILAALCAGSIAAAAAAASRDKYDPGASDKEIKVGQTAPWSGPLSALAEISKTTMAYLAMVNEAGGVNGRRINFISLDDAYSPPKTVEQTRKLVEQEEVLFVYNQVGTPTSIAAQRYLNSKGVPQVFALSGSSKFNDPASPWSSSSMPSYVAEGATFGKYVAAKIKSAKVAILYQNDDFGKDYLHGFRSAIEGNSAVEIVKEASYEPRDPTIDSQIATLAASGADVLLNATTGRASVQSIAGVANTQWRPVHIMSGPFADIETTFRPAGIEKAKGIITAHYIKAVGDPALADDAAIAEYMAFMKKHRPGADANSNQNKSGYMYGQVLVHILREAGNDLTRQNINKVVLGMHEVKFGMMLPSLSVSTSPTQRHLIGRVEMRQFDGERFVPLR